MVVEENEESGSKQALPELDSILDRRKHLKRQRRNRLLQSIWRTGAIGSFAIALGWGLYQPEWRIQGKEQVKILGNTQLSAQSLEQLLPISYPASLIRVRPQKIAEQLQNYAHVEQAMVTRQLLPPQVTVVVQERSPIATTQCKGCVLVHEDQAPFPASDTWLIDAQGVVLPLISYPEIQRTQSLPKLEIEGYLRPSPTEPKRKQGKAVKVSPEIKAQIQEILPLILASPIEIQRVDLRDANNLKLSTSLGVVHLAQYDRQSQTLKQQLETLDQLRSLPAQVDMNKVQYIDLSDPTRPTLTLKEAPNDPQAIESE